MIKHFVIFTFEKDFLKKNITKNIVRHLPK